MSMGHGANYADVVDNDFVKRKSNKKWVEKFWNLVRQTEESWGASELSMRLNDGEPSDDETLQELITVFNKIKTKFQEKTGLTLEINYHDTESGDIYDEVEDYFWSVGDVYTMTPAGKKYAKEIRRAFYVTFG